jgi:hypothetical protein
MNRDQWLARSDDLWTELELRAGLTEDERSAQAALRQTLGSSRCLDEADERAAAIEGVALAIFRQRESSGAKKMGAETKRPWFQRRFLFLRVSEVPPWGTAPARRPSTRVRCRRGRAARVHRARRTRVSSRGDPSPSEPSPRPDLEEAASAAAYHEPRAATYAPWLHDVCLGFSGSSPGRGQLLSLRRRRHTSHKETDMVPNDPHAELRRQINQALAVITGDSRGRVLRHDGSADPATVRRVLILLIKAREALEDGDYDFAYAAAQEAGLELEDPGKP